MVLIRACHPDSHYQGYSHHSHVCALWIIQNAKDTSLPFWIIQRAHTCMNILTFFIIHQAFLMRTNISYSVHTMGADALVTQRARASAYPNPPYPMASMAKIRPHFWSPGHQTPHCMYLYIPDAQCSNGYRLCGETKYNAFIWVP